MRVIKGDICYPKTKAVILPDDSLGTMQVIANSRVSDVGFGSVIKESKKILESRKVELGDCFVTSPGRLKRRGVEKIYHVVIKKLQSDFSSLYIIQKGINAAFKQVVKDGVEEVAICGIGIEPGGVDPISLASIMVDVCKRYNHRVKIKVVDDNDDFINEISKRIKGTVYENA
jgi:O-acetyl-ADP-ribose deacetylase (regulator of RNase III)